ncbi:MAG: R3H domain-containing nucleic acid-binding protein, partial [Thermodesulfobacteriota bacterium]|nr:R3H domain-containing nucleic acid-binding protein [Thermodesulfobacteriota bacterium]
LVDDEKNSGLVIGREGQTIAALQYLANRIVSRKSNSQVRVHLDAGDYREKQDENLRKTALFLANKAKSQGRTQSTRPLSSYHRRVVHLALQNNETVQTKSKGEGPMKRVLIFPRSDRANQRTA